MKRALVLVFYLQAICAWAVEAPFGWKQLQGEKEFTGLALPMRQVGVWRSSDDAIIVQVLQMQPIKDAQGVWNFVGGTVSGLTKAGLAPTSSVVIFDTSHICFRLSGKGKQEGGATGLLDSYFIFADSATFLVKVFSTASTYGFVFTEWNFGTPIRENRDELSHALAQIKDRLDRGVSLAKPSPSPSTSKEEDFESGKDATDDELRVDLRVWTNVVDVMKDGAVNAAKRVGKPPPDPDEKLRGLYRRLANNKFFNIDHEERLHPGYQHELSQVAAIRGEKYHSDSAAYKVGYFTARYGISLGILIFLISRWTRRVSRKTDIRAAQSRSGYYGSLLLKMSWRVALLIVLSIAVVLLSHLRPGLSDKELQNAFAITFLFLFIVVPSAYLITGWSHTKRKFAIQPGVTNDIGIKDVRTETPGTSAAAAKALDVITSTHSTWWKRLFTVIEIAVILLSLGLVVLLLHELTWIAGATMLLGPVALTHLLRIAIIYIVEGKKPFSRYQ